MVKALHTARHASVPIYFQKILLRSLINSGFDAKDLLSGLDIKLSQFDNEEFTLTLEQHTRFIQNVLAVTKDSHLGWRFGQNIDITSLGVLGYAIMASDSGLSAVHTLTQFFKLRAPSYQLYLQNEDGNKESILRIDETFQFTDIRYFMLSCVVSAFDNVFKTLLQNARIIKRVEFACDTPTEGLKDAPSVGYSIEFGAQSTKIYLDSILLNNPLPSADMDIEKTATQICQQMLKNVENDSDIINAVNEVILNSGERYPSLNDAASYLCMSPRTLRRELQKVNTTYQHLLDQTRFQIAKELLLHTRKTASEISFELGFKDPGNFNRAFKAWSGVSPGKFRQL